MIRNQLLHMNSNSSTFCLKRAPQNMFVNAGVEYRLEKHGLPPKGQADKTWCSSSQ